MLQPNGRNRKELIWLLYDRLNREVRITPILSWHMLKANMRGFPYDFVSY